MLLFSSMHLVIKNNTPQRTLKKDCEERVLNIDEQHNIERDDEYQIFRISASGSSGRSFRYFRGTGGDHCLDRPSGRAARTFHLLGTAETNTSIGGCHS